MRLHNKRYNERETNLVHLNNIFEKVKNHHSDDDNNIDDQLDHSTINSYFNENINAPSNPCEVHAFLPLKNYAKDVIRADDLDETIEDLRFRLQDLASPEPCVQPTDQQHCQSKELRRSKRLEQKQKPVYGHQPLSDFRRDSYNGSE